MLEEQEGCAAGAKEEHLKPLTQSGSGGANLAQEISPANFPHGYNEKAFQQSET